MRMTEFRNICNILKDRCFKLPALICCIFLLVSFLPLSLQAKPAPLSAKILMQKGDSCRFVWKYNKSLSYYQQAYKDPAVEKDVELKMQLLTRIMRTHDVLRNWKEMPESSYRLYMLAKEHGDSARIAMALLMRGRRMFSLGQRENGIQVAQHALDIMKRTDYPHKNHEIAYFYSIIAKMYCDNGQYDEALRMSKEQVHYVELSKKRHAQKWYQRNIQRAYTIQLEILAKMGRMAEADSLYAKYGFIAATDPLCGDAMLSYFHLHGMKDKSLEFLKAAMQNIREDGDSIGRNMQRLLNDMGDIYFTMGDYKNAAECFAGTTNIADSLAVRSLNNLTIEVQKVIDNERAIARHDERMTIVISGIVLLVAVMLLIIYQAWAMRRRNKKMTALIQRLMHYRDIIIQNGDAVETEKNVTPNVSEEEMRRFKEMDKRIMKERLFTSSSFGREDLMRMMGVDKNALPTLLQNITGTSVTGYLNIKRMEYAVSLMKEHPEFTLSAIADACGISGASTFIRNFKEAYDMTPSEYRKQMDSASATPPHINI